MMFIKYKLSTLHTNQLFNACAKLLITNMQYRRLRKEVFNKIESMPINLNETIKDVKLIHGNILKS